MAAVSFRPSPTTRNMTSRRVPLANLPNATNSPFRDAVAPGTKRARSHAGDQRELAYAQPPAKKIILEADEDETRRHALLRKSGQNPPTALQRKLEAVRDARADTRPMSRAAEKAQKASYENLESIRQWQRHYKKVFPQIVFYYESIPEDIRSKISRRVQTLGAVSTIDSLNIASNTDPE
jgi:regulatory subunit for Cdc7p protein kinase